MKPSWDMAPPWAQWLAMDEDGYWFWHESRPKQCVHDWRMGGKWQLADESAAKWKDTLEARPVVVEHHHV